MNVSAITLSPHVGSHADAPLHYDPSGVAIGQVDLQTSFGTTDFRMVWPILSKYLDIYQITAGDATATFDYTWADPDYYEQQINMMIPGYDYSSRR